MDRLNYVYIVFRPDGSLLYVGKGTGERWKRHKSRASSNAHYANVLKQAGGTLPVSIIASGLSEPESFALEGILTESIGIESEGGPLVNCGHGGRGGPVGVKRSSEWRAHRRLKAIELWCDESYRAKMLRADRGRSGGRAPRNPAFKAAMSARLQGNTHTLGYKHTDETRAKMSRARKGVPKKPEHVVNMSEAAKRGWIKRRLGSIVSEETRAKIRIAMCGRIVSEETRAKLSAAKKGWKPPPLSPEHQAKLTFASHRHTAEAKEKVAASKRGKPLSPAHRAAISAAKIGKPGHSHTAESRAKIAAAALARHARRLGQREAR